MEDTYMFETFKADAGSFDREFTSFLNGKSGDWKVKSCSYCHDDVGRKTYASCIFKKK
ncbi:MAG: hypothetical protein P4L43_05280 [Syntrophobacteraceae bacterium]|nr:hypothetical protein [Syntrophobacteraceae bacterium]